MPRFNRRVIEEKKCSLKTTEGLIDYLLQRTTRRRNLTICIEEDGSVRVMVPRSATEREVQKFLKDKFDWIRTRAHKARRNYDYIQSRQFAHGQEFLFLGRKYRIEVQEASVKRSRIDFDGATWTVMVPAELNPEERQAQVKDRMIKWYREQAKEILGSRIFHYSRIMDEAPDQIEIRTQKRVWGICDFNKRAINLNWQIIMSPLSVIDYVVVHELSHLKVPNHSRRFWKRVEKFMPDYEKRRKWLKINALDMTLPL